MPWMLFDAAHERGRTEEVPADRIVRRRPRDRRRDAWVLLGDLDSALYQAGVIDVVIERIARPQVIFAGGIPVLDALLALDGRALAFRIGWERIRAAHVLGAAALERAPLARLRRVRQNGHAPANGSTIPFEVLRPAPAHGGGTPELRLLKDCEFVDPNAGSQAAASELVAASLHKRPTAGGVAAAIDAGVDIGANRILVFGVDARLSETQDVARAVHDARAATVDVMALVLENGDRPGVLGYVLPGLGRADRLIESGREAARRWLVESSGEPVAY